jgi:hypothetical protein
MKWQHPNLLWSAWELGRQSRTDRRGTALFVQQVDGLRSEFEVTVEATETVFVRIDEDSEPVSDAVPTIYDAEHGGLVFDVSRTTSTQLEGDFALWWDATVDIDPYATYELSITFRINDEACASKGQFTVVVDCLDADGRRIEGHDAHRNGQAATIIDISSDGGTVIVEGDVTPQWAAANTRGYERALGFYWNGASDRARADLYRLWADDGYGASTDTTAGAYLDIDWYDAGTNADGVVVRRTKLHLREPLTPAELRAYVAGQSKLWNHYASNNFVYPYYTTDLNCASTTEWRLWANRIGPIAADESAVCRTPQHGWYTPMWCEGRDSEVGFFRYTRKVRLGVAKSGGDWPTGLRVAEFTLRHSDTYFAERGLTNVIDEVPHASLSDVCPAGVSA